jgi:hypothetical protein
VRFFFFFAAIMSHDSGKRIAEGDTKLADPKVFMEAMMSEMRCVMKMEMEQVHERIFLGFVLSVYVVFCFLLYDSRRPALLSYFSVFFFLGK